MAKNQEYQHITSKKAIIVSQDNQTINVPDYVSKAYTRYRYNNADSTLEKQCFKCKQWFPVLILENGQLIDCHRESDYHYMGQKSGYGSYCAKCSSPQVAKTAKKEEMVDYTACLTKDNLRYMGMICAALGINKRCFINKLIEEEKQRNPITKYV